ncbi:alpha/beta hydrolase [Streptomyces sp. Je 1-4]|uniref:alpha/beta fold hydrolase n=1 Tax=Streptomyces TaxID=1883 RepID=UPI0021D958E8|nr:MULTISPECIES: alpha/beta hydrolase [unclassified Streptomyces]UYB41479.1 alpha/beta hydrolase [Streptomyces sp. Je 1-4]UZQ37716.1 alpha/beta hydrolase [Streptomyces sp. Je 1-4] [Streptomyces sp. Je 1-4 4N24]UZQ45133.1 alpha/beta hydrolase [Streptomyces sp. Je 1-4] [Streptomyces sp. Je 1-4 4N24_ara]
MDSIYRSTTGRELIRRWCLDQLAAWPVPHERKTVTAKGASTHVVLAGSGATTVVFVPGTNFNAAASLPLATALVAAGHRVLLVDVPGQPGLSSGERNLFGGQLSWYGAWLSEVIEKISSEPVAVMGHSFGAAIALSSDCPRIDRLILASPGGLARLRLTPTVLAASAAWFLRPAPTHSTRLLRAMLAPGHLPREELVNWMTLVARHSRSSGAPGAATPPARSIPRLVVTGEHDVFLPPRRLSPAVRATLGAELGVIPEAGHLVVEERPEYLSTLLEIPGQPTSDAPVE